jgi:hypothetical protein
MNVKLLFLVLALGVLGAGWIAGAGTGAGYAFRSPSVSVHAAAAARPELDLFSTSPQLGAKATTDVGIQIPATAAEAEKVTLFIPAGYGFDIAAPPGTSEGQVAMQTASDFGFGELKAADPAAYVNTAAAQACAPGSHAAVWTMHFDAGLFASKPATVPIYIDPTSGAETALGAYKLQACLPLAEVVSSGGSPLGSKVRSLAVEFTSLTNPTSTSLYVWRAFVSNPDTNGNPDPSTTYELRSDMPLPAKLSLTGRLDRKHHRALLSGRLTTPALPVAGVPVALFRVTGLGWWYEAGTRTATNGSYRFIRSIRKTTTFGVAASGIEDCNASSTAPRGCASETLAEIDSPSLRIVVRRGH